MKLSIPKIDGDMWKWIAGSLFSLLLFLAGILGGVVWGNSELDNHRTDGHPGLVARVESLHAIQERQVAETKNLRQEVHNLSLVIERISGRVELIARDP